jgi:hypothetical protein
MRVNHLGILKKTKLCGTCNIVKPFRSHHCADCENCVERFDHHCPWLGNCVARRNYIYYYTFITLLNFLCMYLVSLSVVHIVYSTEDFLKIYTHFDEDKKVPNALVSSKGSCIVSIFVIIFNFFMMIFVTGLFVYHSILICFNLTTKEELKKSFKGPVGNPYNMSCLTNAKRILFPKMQTKSINEELTSPYKIVLTDIQVNKGKGKIIRLNFNRKKVEEIYKDFNYNYEENNKYDANSRMSEVSEEVDDTNYKKGDNTTDRNKKVLSSCTEEKERSYAGREAREESLSNNDSNNFNIIKRTRSRFYEVNDKTNLEDVEDIIKGTNYGNTGNRVSFNLNISINEEDVSREKTKNMSYITNVQLSEPKLPKSKDGMVSEDKFNNLKNWEKTGSARNVEDHNQNLNVSATSKSFFKKYTFN